MPESKEKKRLARRLQQEWRANRLMERVERLSIHNMMPNQCGGGSRVNRKHLAEDQDEGLAATRFYLDRWYDWEGY